jgi:hypothetical protein
MYLQFHTCFIVQKFLLKLTLSLWLIKNQYMKTYEEVEVFDEGE